MKASLFSEKKYKQIFLNHIKYTYITFAISSSLAGCGNSSTSIVKDSYIDEGMTMTASQLLDNRRICGDVEWDSFEDSNKRKIVEYKCTLINTKDFLAKKRSSYIDNQGIALHERIKNLKEEIRTREANISDLTANGAKIVEDRLAQLSGKTPETSDRLVKLARIVDQFNKLKSNYNDFNYINLLLSDDFQNLLGGYGSSQEHDKMLNYFNRSNESFRAQVGWMQSRKTIAEQERYKKENVDDYLKEMKKYINELNIYFRDQMAIEKDKIAEEKLNYTKSLESMRKSQVESIEGDVAKHKENIASLRSSILSAEEELKNLKNTSDEKFPQYEKIIEKYQWIVNKENVSQPVYGELVAISSDNNKNKILIKHMNPRKTLQIISRIDAKNHDEYIEKLSAIAFLNFIYN